MILVVMPATSVVVAILPPPVKAAVVSCLVGAKAPFQTSAAKAPKVDKLLVLLAQTAVAIEDEA